MSRYICYLIIQNADPSKEVVALGQTYFAIQTRKYRKTKNNLENEIEYLQYKNEKLKNENRLKKIK